MLACDHSFGIYRGVSFSIDCERQQEKHFLPMLNRLKNVVLLFHKVKKIVSGTPPHLILLRPWPSFIPKSVAIEPYEARRGTVTVVFAITPESLKKRNPLRSLPWRSGHSEASHTQHLNGTPGTVNPTSCPPYNPSFSRSEHPEACHVIFPWE